MSTKVIPERLQSSPRLLRKPRRKARVTTSEIYSTPGGNKNGDSLDEIDDFVDIGSLSLWDITAASSPSNTETPVRNESGFTSPPKSSGRTKYWFHRRKKTTDAVTPNSASKMSSTASAILEPDLTAHRSRSVPNLKIELPQLTLEQLAKIDAFYAPTPVLPETPAPRMGKVYPSWSPDIDYRFNPKPARSSSLRVVKTAGLERGCSREESLKRLKALGSISATPVPTVTVSHGRPTVFPQTPPSCSESAFHSQQQQSTSRPSSARHTEEDAGNWRQTWIYSQGEDEMYSNFDGNPVEDFVRVQYNDAQTADGLKTPTDFLSSVNGLYFTMGESPIADAGEVTLRFIEDPFRASVPSHAHEVDAPQSSLLLSIGL